MLYWVTQSQQPTPDKGSDMRKMSQCCTRVNSTWFLTSKSLESVTSSFDTFNAADSEWLFPLETHRIQILLTVWKLLRTIIIWVYNSVMDHWPEPVTAVEPLGDHPTSIFPLFIVFFLLLLSTQQSRERNLKTPLPFIKGQSSSTKQLIFPWTKPKLLWETAGHQWQRSEAAPGCEGDDRGQTPECSSHTFRHHPGAHLHPCTAGDSQELGHYLEPLQGPSTPVISAAMIFDIYQRLKSQVFRLQSTGWLCPLWGKLSQ